MRKTAIAIAFVLVATLGILVPSVSAAVGEPKVVIVVGATHGATAGYRADGDRAYAEARKYTRNVVKVYSPNATWAKVKAAVVGASVVIYMGHGNGWPSPYTYDPKYSTKDGMGLNATAGNGDANVKYYGEPYMAQLQLAPGAVILLHHLCYASGNSEPGHAAPTVTVARERADNYTVGFLKAGASAVIADGHSGAERYLRALFTTHQSIERLWRRMPNSAGNIVSFPSVRTTGATIYQDPNTPTSGFYRSMGIGLLGVTTDEVMAAGYDDTGVDPASLVVPGNAAVATDGAALFGDLATAGEPTGEPIATLPAGTRLRVVVRPIQTTALGEPLVEVAGVDDPSIAGYMLVTDLAARDSAAPVVRVLDPGGPFSPNGDGSRDQASLRGRFTESVAWRLRVHDGAGELLYETTGSGSTFTVAWDGTVGGAPVADGTYPVSVTGVDAWDNGVASATRQLVVDTRPPALANLSPGSEVTQWFSPNGDGVQDTVGLTATSPENGALVVRVMDADGDQVKKWTLPNGTVPEAITWNGRTTAGGYAPDGTYSIRVAAQDLAGNTGAYVERTVTLVAALRSVATGKALFFPHDLDSLANNTLLTFTLARPMTVTWTIRDATGAVVITHFDAVALPAGVQSWKFYGRTADGTLLPRGRYRSSVTAVDGTLSATQSVAFDAEAFTFKVTDTTPKRGQTITFTITSAEKLDHPSRLYIYQPGVGRYSVRLTKVSTYTYRATVRLKSSGGSGMVRFKLKGYDINGGTQTSVVAYPIH